MNHLNGLLDAVIEASVHTVLSGFDAVADEQIANRAHGSELRGNATAQALFGPSLTKLVGQLTGEIERRCTIRYADMLKHPRRCREALIDELTDAEAGMNIAITRTDHSPTLQQALHLTLAAIRVRAITRVLDDQAFVSPVRDNGRRTQRRRDITAADVGPVLAEQILAMAYGGVEWNTGLLRLGELERTAANKAGVVTKLLVLLDHPEGSEHLNRIAKRLSAAERQETTTVISAASSTLSPKAHAGTAASTLPLPPVTQVPTRSVGRDRMPISDQLAKRRAASGDSI